MEFDRSFVPVNLVEVESVRRLGVAPEVEAQAPQLSLISGTKKGDRPTSLRDPITSSLSMAINSSRRASLRQCHEGALSHNHALHHDLHQDQHRLVHVVEPAFLHRLFLRTFFVAAQKNLSHLSSSSGGQERRRKKDGSNFF